MPEHIPPWHPPATIVVVDDVEHNLTLMAEAMLLCDAPLPLTTILGGEAALAFMQSLQEDCGPLPCVMLLDISMPRINGFAVLSALKQHARTAGIHVCMCSTSSARMDIARARMLGADSYVTKPASLDALVGLLSDVVQWIEDGRQSHRPLPFPHDLITSNPPSTRRYHVC